MLKEAFPTVKLDKTSDTANLKRANSTLSTGEKYLDQPGDDKEKADYQHGIGDELDGAPEKVERLGHSPKALEALNCLIKVMDDFIVPVVRGLRDRSRTKVYFRDLWYLFQSGDNVVVSWKDTLSASALSPRSDSSSDQKTANEQAAWRILEVAGGRPILSGSNDYYGQPPKKKVDPFWIRCYEIDYNELGFGPIEKYFTIEPFEGEKEISSLKILPFEKAKDSDKLRRQLVERGRKFIAITAGTWCHQMYRGWTLNRHPTGAICDEAKTPERVDGQVIVDSAAAARDSPGWGLLTGLNDDLPNFENETVENGWPLEYWSGTEIGSAIFDGEDDDTIYDDSHIDRWRMRNLVRGDAFLSDFDSKSEDAFLNSGHLDEKSDYHLLPNRLPAFLLDQHRFALINVDGLESIRAEPRGWRNLVLNSEHRSMIEAQVQTFFSKKKSRDLANDESANFDLVSGKGEGLIILLHGGPGVGKTSTVECLRAALAMPLLSLSCGNLGDKPEEVENKLDMLFRTAGEWNCLLLLDEAEIVLLERGTLRAQSSDAIVSVFLRKLEYYKGILFLTTNRVGTLDEAVKSRIHLALEYSPFTEDFSKKVWDNNLRLFKVHREYKDRIIVNTEDIREKALAYAKAKKLSRGWNGRIIRNICQTAVSLAEHDADPRRGIAPDRPGEVGRPETVDLDWSHFERVLALHDRFDKYWARIGKDDISMRHMRIRNDGFKMPLTEGL